MDKARILVVDDHEPTAQMVRLMLGREGHEVASAGSVADAQEEVRRRWPDLIVLDRGLPDKDGLELLAWIRENAKGAMPLVLVLTGKTRLSERVRGLEEGGDDYLGKPFAKAEFLARVNALLRRAGKAAGARRFTSGALLVDLDARKAELNGEPIELWPKEFDLLAAFLERPGRVLSRTFLLENVWGYEEAAQLTTNVVEVTVSHLRRKLGPAGKAIVAVRGHGYRYDEPS